MTSPRFCHDSYFKKRERKISEFSLIDIFPQKSLDT